MKLVFHFDTQETELPRNVIVDYLTDPDEAEGITDEELIALLNENAEALEELANDYTSTDCTRVDLEPST